MAELGPGQTGGSSDTEDDDLSRAEEARREWGVDADGNPKDWDEEEIDGGSGGDDEPDYSRPAPDERMEDIGTGGSDDDGDDSVDDTGTPTNRPDVSEDDPRRPDTGTDSGSSGTDAGSEPDTVSGSDSGDSGGFTPDPIDDSGSSKPPASTGGTQSGIETGGTNPSIGYSTLDDDLSQSELQTLRDEGYDALSPGAKDTIQSEFQEDAEKVGLPTEDLTPVVIGDQLQVFEGEVTEADIEAEQARMLESDVVGGRDTPLDRDDIIITSGQDDTLEATLSRSGEEQAIARELGVSEEDIGITESGDVVGTTETGEETLALERIAAGVESEYPDREGFSIDQEEPGVYSVEVETDDGTEEFITGNAADQYLEEQREQQREAAVTELEQQLEQQVGAAQADASAPISGTVGRALEQAGADLERGEDYRITETEDGLSAELTDSAESELQNLQAERQLESFYQTDLDAEDVQVDETGSVTLTDSGQQTVEESGTVPVEQSGLSAAVEGVRETLGLDALDDRGIGAETAAQETRRSAAGMDELERDTPGGDELVNRVPVDKILGEYEKEAEGLAERPAAATIRRDAAGMDEVDQEFADSTLTGDIEIPIPDRDRQDQNALASRRRELRGEDPITRDAPDADTLGEYLANSQEQIAQEIAAFELGADDTADDLGPGPRGQMTAEPFDREGNVREFFDAGLKAPATVAASAPFTVPSLGLGATEVATKGAVATASGDLDEFTSAATTAGLAAGVRGAETAVDEPAQTAGAVTGSLVGTGALFGASRAAGSTANLATRAAIQPGEELLGKGGAAVVPGRAGQVLFPRGEPLFASEEAAIYAAQRGSQAVRDSPLGTAGSRAADLGGQAARRAESRLSTEIGQFESDMRQVAREIRQPEPVTTAEVEAGAETRRFYEPAQTGLRDRSPPTDPDDVLLIEDRRRFFDDGPSGEVESETDLDGDDEFTIGGSGGDAIEVDVRTGRGVQTLELERQFEEETAGVAVEQTSRRFDVPVESEMRSESETFAEVSQREVEPFAGMDVGRTQPQSEPTALSEFAEMETEQAQSFEEAFELDQPTELETDSESEVRLESELEQEFEQELELEQEQEVELESFLESELEQEQEVETELPFEDSGMDEDTQGLDFAEWQRTYGTGVASVEDLLGGE